MGRPAFAAIYRSILAWLKRHFTFSAAVTANGRVNGLLMELLKNMVILEARPSGLGVTQHLRFIL